jgi:hypothetical protein
MKKLDVSDLVNFGPLVVWADDLKDIADVLSEIDANPEIVADDTQFDSAEELIDKFKEKTVRKISFEARNPHIILTLSQQSASVYISARNTTTLGILNKLSSILQAREHRPRALYLPLYVVSAQLIILALLVIGATFGIIRYNQSLVALLIVGIMYIAWMSYIFYLSTKKFCVIHVMRKLDKPGFLRSNADKIAIAIVSAIIGAFAKFSFDLLEKHLGGDYARPELSAPEKQEKHPSGEN